MHNWSTPDTPHSIDLSFRAPTVQHKAEVAPIFLANHQVSQEGSHISLMQIATSVCQSLEDSIVVDAVQPMRTGWNIYVCTLADRQVLINKRLMVVGKYVMLQSEYLAPHKKSVKVMIKDLPLHSVDNEEVLDALKDICDVLSPVNYSNVWHNGQMTNIRNGDRFVYIEVGDLSKIPDTITVGEYQVRIFRPKAVTICKCCQKEGHLASDDMCEALVPQDIQDSVEVF